MGLLLVVRLLLMVLLGLVVRRGRLGGISSEMLLGLVRRRRTRTAATSNGHSCYHRRYKYSLHSPPWSLEDVDSGAGMLAQMLRPSDEAGWRCLAAVTYTVTARRLADKTGNMTTIWPGLLEGAFAGHCGNC